MKKVAVLYTGNVEDRKGAINATLARIEYLSRNSDYEITPMLLKNYGLFMSTKYLSNKVICVDGKETKVIAHYYSLLWYLICSKLFKHIVFGRFLYGRIAKMLKNYDLVIAHSMECGYIAYLAKQKYKIPYSVTWHGSDIHTTPFNNSYVRDITKTVIENANINFFVSKSLQEISNTITEQGEKDVLYNGIDKSRFCIINKTELEDFKGQMQFNDEAINIAFVGNLVSVKNVFSLPLMFYHVQKEIQNVKFHIIGDGPLRNQLRDSFIQNNVQVTFHGNIPNELMPKVYNCLDLVVLPSFNEGLALVSAEAISCGCKFVGSRVGGIPEVVGTENTVVIDNDFPVNMARKVVSIIKDKEYRLPDISSFNWDTAALKEIEYYKRF